MRPHFRRFTGDLGVSNGGWKEARSTPIIGEVSTGRKVKQVGLSPEVPVNARVLVLGSFPGRESLRQRAYYAHPDNLFWAFMQELLGIPRTLPYRERLRRLNRLGVGLWDVLARCRRPGSLDRNVRRRDLELNDLLALFRRHPAIAVVFCNGSLAYELFVHHLVPGLAPQIRSVTVEKLPSTSPANRYMPYGEKLAAWRRLERVLRRDRLP